MEKVIIALTSYPGRISKVCKVIESLCRQQVCAEKIILYLSVEEFPEREGNLPKELLIMLGQSGFSIQWVEGNLKSHKKYFYALQTYRDDIVITVDDDVIYARTLISDLLSGYKKYPKAISARRTRMITRDGEYLAKYNDWDNYDGEFGNIPRVDLCAIGVGGVLYPPACTSDRWFDKKSITAFAGKQDDLWLKFNEILENIPVVYIKPTEDDVNIESLQDTTLYMENRAGANDVSINNLTEWLREIGDEVYRKWFNELINREDYISIKKSFYCEYARKIFAEYADIPVYLYGAGRRAEKILSFLEDAQMRDGIEAVLVSDKRDNPEYLQETVVKQIDEVEKNKLFAVIYGVGNKYTEEVNKVLRNYNYVSLDLNIQAVLPLYD